ncbi:MAG: ABC transporter permease subunit [bacterium]|jgi:ABC-type transport system involved in multi-copper enzyme maturation permease subunit|nr:ABC transporter permease subunit [bacterium]MBK9775778.1 ABC transporter permease subunit [bacterium]
MMAAENTVAPAGNDVHPMGSLAAAGWLAWFSVREMARRRRLVSLVAINLLPVLVVAAIRIWFPQAGVTAQMLLASLSHDVFMPFLIPVVALAVGVPAIGEQVDDGTIVFTWTRPIHRRAIYLGRLLAAQVVSTLVLCLSLVLCFVVMVTEGPQVLTWDFLRLYLQTFVIIGLGAFTYAALFATMGTFFRKPVLPAILFAFGWENLVSSIPARVQELSLRFHLQNLVTRPESAPQDLPGLLGALLSTAFEREPVPKLQSIGVLVAVMLLSTVLGIWLLRQKEIAK